LGEGEAEDRGRAVGRADARPVDLIIVAADVQVKNLGAPSKSEKPLFPLRKLTAISSEKVCPGDRVEPKLRIASAKAVLGLA